ncbi:histidine kinase [Solitalea sp. MAHUQ-68]|uniref:Histidine kinase n=1 Tax=Solitalea agri TaxID=2953739 RepID=A0A9X2F2J9_9SPHI|nr:histidine kinase [Solitalea agri]MCO4292984.1 histidine kinase [Solitalea agri]
MSQPNSVQKKHEHSLLYYNLKYGKTGLVVGVAICLLNYLQDFKLSGKSIFISFLFSIVITHTITNLIYLSRCLFNRKKEYTPKEIALDLALMFVGIFFATEFCFFMIYLIYGNWVSFDKQIPSIAFNLFLGFLIGGFRQLNMLQKVNYELKLRDSDYQLAKLQELKTRAELEALQSKINPHFLYNSLNSIASLIHQDADKAEEMVLKLSKLFRYAINSSDENYTSLAYEIDIVKTYLDIESIRLGDRLQTTFTIDNSLNEEKIPRFLLQPLIENSIKHGISKVAQHGKIEIGAERTNENELKLWVADNGPDFPTELNPGYGLQSTFDKLKLLYNDEYKLNIMKTPEKRIQIIIPKFVFKS